MIEAAPPDVRGATVLVVDDERAWRRVVSTDLTLLGYVPITAEDASEALAIVEQTPPDAAIVDLMLPEPMHGWELAMEFRRRNVETALIFYSAYPVFQTLPPISNVVGYISKGDDRVELYAMIPAAIRLTRRPGPAARRPS
ncbi:MAG: response regulator [Candidatus Dormibacteraceae bacterium]